MTELEKLRDKLLAGRLKESQLSEAERHLLRLDLRPHVRRYSGPVEPFYQLTMAGRVALTEENKTPEPEW